MLVGAVRTVTLMLMVAAKAQGAAAAAWKRSGCVCVCVDMCVSPRDLATHLLLPECLKGDPEGEQLIHDDTKAVHITRTAQDVLHDQLHKQHSTRTQVLNEA